MFAAKPREQVNTLTMSVTLSESPWPTLGQEVAYHDGMASTNERARFTMKARTRDLGGEYPGE